MPKEIIIIDSEYADDDESKKGKEVIKKEAKDLVPVNQGRQLMENSIPEECPGRIEQLKKELEEARQKYAEADYKVNNNISKMKSFFGKFLKTEPMDVTEVNEAFTTYKNKASELSRSQIDVIKNNKNLDPETMRKELGDLVKYFNYDEKMNLYESRTKARAEANKNNIAFQALKGSGWLINKYRKLNWKTKLIGGAIFGVITGGSLVMAQRGFGSVVAGVGAMATMEALQRRSENKKSEKETQNMLKGFENSEEQMKRIVSYLEGEINEYEANLKDELKKARTRKFIGLAAGAGTFVAGNYIGGFLREHLISGLEKVEDVIPENTDPLAPETAKVSGENFPAGEAPKSVNMFSPEDITAKPQANGAAERILEVKKGSSLEGTLTKHLEASGMSREEAGSVAHKMALEYAKNNNLKDGPYSLIHEGAKLQLTPDGKGIMGIFGDNKIGYLPKNEIPSGGKSQFFEETKIGKNADPMTARNNPGWQRDETLAKISENESKIKSLNQRHEELLREINNVKGIENARPGVHQDLLEVQQDIEQLRKTNQGLGSNLENLNKNSSSSAFNASSENGMTQETPVTSKAEPLGNRTAVSQEEWKGNGSGTKYMRSFEHNFGNVEENKQLFNALSEKKFIGSDPSVTAKNIKASFFDAYGKKSVFVSLQDKSMNAIIKDPETRLQIFKGFKSGDQITFEKMLKAVPPEKHPGESLHRWISRVAFAMENIKGK